MINLTAAQCKASGFSHAEVSEISPDEFTVIFNKGEDLLFGVLDQQGKTKTYKSLSTAAAFAKSCGVHTLQVKFMF